MQQPKLKAEEPSEEEEEPQELAHFRSEWLAELQRKKTGTSSSTPTAAPTPVQVAISKSYKDLLPQTRDYLRHSSQTISGHPSVLSNVSSSSIDRGLVPLPQTISSALNVYRQAVEHEQRGDLDHALLLYRQAFRMDSNVDVVYHREEKLASVFSVNQASGHATGTDGIVDEPISKTQHTLTLKPAGPKTAAGVITGTLAELISDFSEDSSFEPQDEQASVPLRKLPDELLVMILRKLDPTSIERFAAVNRKSRIVTLESSIWKDLVSATYKPPQVPDIESMTPVVERYLSDFRRVYIEHPRVRVDGVYIATCHYVRPGLHENSWVNISHLITYQRYLRFYPNGRVLSLLVNEEHTPQHIIPLLKPTLRMKGFFIGTWCLSSSTIYLSNLIDASGRFPLPDSCDNLWDSSFKPELSPSYHHALNNASGIPERNQYAFLMSLNLRSRPLGRWNKLTIETYESVNLQTGDTSPIVLKHERPFWFSKVRSYATY